MLGHYKILLMPKSNMEPKLQSGYQIARLMTRRYATSFYFASHLLKPELKRSAYCIYSICRLIDEAVDGQTRGKDITALAQLQNYISLAYDNKVPVRDDLWQAFSTTVTKHSIPKEYFNILIEGVKMDIEKKRYSDFPELEEYCYKVAGIVGLMMLKIFNSKDDQMTQQYAINLGKAMQLTNILRDIKEDWEYGRLYIPQNELLRFHVSEEEIGNRQRTERFIELMKFQIQRTRHFYKEADKGIRMLQGLDSRIVVATMRNLYAGILNEIEHNNYDVLKKRVYVNFLQKIKLISKAALSSLALDQIRNDS